MRATKNIERRQPFPETKSDRSGIDFRSCAGHASSLADAEHRGFQLEAFSGLQFRNSFEILHSVLSVEHAIEFVAWHWQDTSSCSSMHLDSGHVVAESEFFS